MHRSAFALPPIQLPKASKENDPLGPFGGSVETKSHVPTNEHGAVAIGPPDPGAPGDQHETPLPVGGVAVGAGDGAPDEAAGGLADADDDGVGLADADDDGVGLAGEPESDDGFRFASGATMPPQAPRREKARREAKERLIDQGLAARDSHATGFARLLRRGHVTVRDRVVSFVARPPHGQGRSSTQFPWLHRSGAQQSLSVTHGAHLLPMHAGVAPSQSWQVVHAPPLGAQPDVDRTDSS